MSENKGKTSSDVVFEQETDVWDIASPNYCKKRHKT